MKFKVQGYLTEGRIIIEAPEYELVIDTEPDPKTPEEKPVEEKPKMLKLIGERR